MLLRAFELMCLYFITQILENISKEDFSNKIYKFMKQLCRFV